MSNTLSRLLSQCEETAKFLDTMAAQAEKFKLAAVNDAGRDFWRYQRDQFTNAAEAIREEMRNAKGGAA